LVFQDQGTDLTSSDLGRRCTVWIERREKIRETDKLAEAIVLFQEAAMASVLHACEDRFTRP
jgi:hypothetical protein